MPLDIGIGILSALAVAKFLDLPLDGTLILWGIAFALLPDLDFLYELVRTRGQDHRAIARHRDRLHYPLLYVPLGLLLTLTFGREYGLIFTIASLGHFLHDSIGIGWGIPWLWPLTNRNYTFLYRYVAPGKLLPRQAIYRWERWDIDRLMREYGDPQWLRNLYFRMHPFVLVEFIGLVIALVTLMNVTSGAKIERALGDPLVPEAKATAKIGE